MIVFVIGFLIGGFLGMMLMAILVSARKTEVLDFRP